MLGLKFFRDTPKELATQIIERAHRDQLGLEILMLDWATRQPGPVEEMAWILDETPFTQAGDHILHLDNVNTFGFNITQPETLRRFSSEMNTARHFGIKKVVMHYNDKLPLAEMRADKLASDLKRINELGGEYGLTVHIENTLFLDAPGNIDFYELMFNSVAEQGLGQIGFCFDIGHGKALSTNPLAEWLAFVDKLHARGTKLHFHLHNNFGKNDDHMSFRLAEAHGLNEGDAYTGGRSYIDVIASLIARYPGMKLQEIPAEEALANLDWLQAKLAGCQKD